MNDVNQPGVPESPSEASANSAGNRSEKKLNNLFLDPNNFRFIENSEYKEIAVEKLTDPVVQRRTAGFLMGENLENGRDLLASFTTNGWLNLEPIQVKELPTRGKYLVVEGNRRIAVLKYLKRRYEEGGYELGNLSPEIFDKVPVVMYEDAGEERHLVIMGLSHISGKRKWPAVNQARALFKLLHDHRWSENEVCAAIGMEKRALRQIIRTLALCDAYIAGDFGAQFRAEQYNLFREVVKSPNLRSWLQWAEDAEQPGNQANLHRLFSWFSREEGDEEGAEEAGRTSPEAVITTGADVRELGKIINDENALRALDETRRLSEATYSSSMMMRDKLAEGLRKINANMDILFTYATKLSAEDLQNLELAMGKLRGVFAAATKQPVLVAHHQLGVPFNAIRPKHFSDLTIGCYRRLRDINISGLRRINLFVGPNNAGKSSLLEGVLLLVSQNDINGLLNVICRRAKLNGAPPATWVSEQIAPKAMIAGTYGDLGDRRAEVIIENLANGEDLDDKAFYLTTIEIFARYCSQTQHSTTHLFEQRPRVTKFGSCHVLCPVVLSTPFTQHDPELLVDLFNRSVEGGSKEEVVRFLRENVDAKFRDVDAHTGTGGKMFTRFRVKHDDFLVAPDLASFGDGVQRIFHIGLLFAYARDGVVLLDEFENGIHHSLLSAFGTFVYKLAVQFNVQVFLTSHSKECVDALARSELPEDDLSAYAFRLEVGGTRCYHYPGPKLKFLIEEVDLDVRGAQPGV